MYVSMYYALCIQGEQREKTRRTLSLMTTSEYMRVYTVKSRFNEWSSSAPFHSLNRDFTLNWDILMWNFSLVTIFRSLNWDFTLNRDSLNRDFTVLVFFFFMRFWHSFCHFYNFVSPTWNFHVSTPAISLLKFLWWVVSSEFTIPLCPALPPNMLSLAHLCPRSKMYFST